MQPADPSLRRPAAAWTSLASLGLVLLLAAALGCQRKTSSLSAPPPPASRAAAEPAAPANPGTAPASPAVLPSNLSGRALADALSQTFEAAAARVGPSVVPVFAESVVHVHNPFNLPGQPFEPFFGRHFFQRFFGVPGEQRQTVHSLGSGVIVSKDGYILTNNHVVAGAQKLTIAFPDHDNVSAKVIGTDPESDLAVIQVKAPNLTPATLGNSDDVKIGEWVIAVGNPFALLHTVTAGIISAKGRSSLGLAQYEDFIQTDAAINPGNSGGALADLDGNVIAINTAISTPSGGNVGIGLAIPINMAKWVMKQLIEHGKVVRGYLGVLVQDLSPNLSEALELKTTQGALVAQVVSGGPADHAGVQRGDVIVGLNGTPIHDSHQLRDLVAQDSPGTKVTLKVLRKGREKEISVELGEQPQKKKTTTAASTSSQGHGRVGLAVQTLTPQMAEQLGEPNARGVLVTAVAQGSPAADAGIQPGDIVEAVEGHRITTAEELAAALSKAKSGESIALLVRRKGNTFFVPLRIP